MSMMALAQQLQTQGRGNDSILAHINPAEAAMLEAAGGSGTLNPDTGLPEYGWLDDLWNGVKKVWTNTVVPLVKKLAPVIIPAVSIFFPAAIPAIGAWFGATGTAAAVVGTAALSAGVTLAAGGTLEQAIKGAALGAAASYVTPILGAKANALLGGSLSPAVQSYLGSALVSGGISAARGGSVRDVFTAAATGAATAYLGTLAKNYYQSINDKIETGKLNITQKTADGSLITAADAETYKKAGLSEQQIASALKAQGVSDAHANLAAKSIVANNSAEQTATILAEYAGKSGNAVMNATTGKDAIANSVTLGNNTDILLRAEDANLMAQDAVALRAKGLSSTEIQNHLEASGASTAYARQAAQLATNGSTAANIANTIQNSAQYNSKSTDVNYAQGRVYNNTDYVVPREVGQIMNQQQQDLASTIPYKDMVTAGTITVDQAATYSDAGYKPADVTRLLSVGYDAADLQDLAGVGVKATDLVSLSNSKFAESQINDLMHAGASVTDIATASNAVNTGKIDVNTASQLLSRDISGNSISTLAAKGQAQTVLNSNLTGSTVDKLVNGGFDLNRVVTSGVDANKIIADNATGYGRILDTAMADATAAQATAKTVADVAKITGNGASASALVQNGFTAADVSKLTSLGYTPEDLLDLRTVGITPNQLVSLGDTPFQETQINDMMKNGASLYDITQTGNIVKSGRIDVDTASGLLNKNFDIDQINYVRSNRPDIDLTQLAASDIDSATFSKLASSGTKFSDVFKAEAAGLDVNNALSQDPNWRTAVSQYAATPPGTVLTRDAAGRIGYFEAATGNTLDATGKITTFARAPDVSAGTQIAGPGKVEVSGIVGRVGNESSVRGPLSEGSTLATQADIDAGRAVVNTEANAWEVTQLKPLAPAQNTTVESRPVTPVEVDTEQGYTYTTPPGETVGPPAPPNGYTYTTPPGEFVGPLPPTGSDQMFVMPDGTRLRYDGTATYLPDGSFSNLGTPERFGAEPENTSATTSPVVPPTQVTSAPLPGPVPFPITEPVVAPPAPPVVAPPASPVVTAPVTEPVVAPPGYTYTTPPGEVVGPPAPPVVAPPGYTYTTPPGEVVGPPAPVVPEVTPPSVTVPGQQDDGTIVVTAPREPELPPLLPLEPVEITPRPVTPVVAEPPDTPPTGPAPVEVITPATPYVPVPTPETPADPAVPKGYGPITPLVFGKTGQINNPGLNPGFIQPSPFYRTSSPVQSQYYYGQHPYQPGPTFNQTLYNTVPGAPQTPFGLQQMYTPTDLNAYLAQFTAGPVAPR